MKTPTHAPQSQLQRFIGEMKARGVKVEIVPSADAATLADIVVCAEYTKPMIFPDNVRARCAECGKRLQLRPDVPEGPKRVCYKCAGQQDKFESGECVIFITVKTALELAMRHVLH